MTERDILLVHMYFSPSVTKNARQNEIYFQCVYHNLLVHILLSSLLLCISLGTLLYKLQLLSVRVCACIRQHCTGTRYHLYRYLCKRGSHHLHRADQGSCTDPFDTPIYECKSSPLSYANSGDIFIYKPTLTSETSQLFILIFSKTKSNDSPSWG